MMNQYGRRPCSTASVNTRFGTAAFLCSATLGVVLATGSVFAAVPPALQFIRHDIDTGLFGQVTQGAGVGDIDGDGRPDIVVGGDNYLVWFHNPDWTPHLIASGFKFAGGAQVVVRDIDGDGRLDVMTGKYPPNDNQQRQTVWYGNTPTGWVKRAQLHPRHRGVFVAGRAAASLGSHPAAARRLSGVLPTSALASRAQMLLNCPLFVVGS